MSRVLLRGARVITLASDRPDWEAADILVEDSRIVDISRSGQDLASAADEVLNFAGRIVMPGLINAHLHTWQTALRTVGADWTLAHYLANSHGTLVRQYRPADMRIAALAGALGQLSSGTTTIGDWCHGNSTPEHSDAAVEGLLQSGIRAVFLHGTPYTGSARHPTSELDRLIAGPARGHELLTVGMAILGPQQSSAELSIADFRAACEREVVVSMHHSGGAPKPAWEAVRREGLFGPLTNVAHGSGMPEELIRSLVESGVTFTVTPENELGQGHGAPITARLKACGAAPSLGTDTDCVVAGDVLTSARIALAHHRGLDHDRQRHIDGLFSMDPTITSKEALSWATVEGAKALGLADQVGTLLPGMQADLIVIDARALNLWPAHDPIAAALHSSFGNIEAVMVAGQWRKWAHALIDVDLRPVQDELAESADRLLPALLDPGFLGRVRHRIVQRVVRHRLNRDLRT